MDQPQTRWERYHQLGGIQVFHHKKYVHVNSSTFPHRQNVYGFLDEEDAEEEEHGFSYKQMEARDSRRWSMADLDHSGELDIQVTRILQGGSVKSANSGVFCFPSP